MIIYRILNKNLKKEIIGRILNKILSLYAHKSILDRIGYIIDIF